MTDLVHAASHKPCIIARIDREDLVWQVVLCSSGHPIHRHINCAFVPGEHQGWISVHDMFNWLGQQLHSAAGILLEEA